MIRLFHVYIPTGTFLVGIFEILLAASAFVFATYLLVDVDPTDYLLNNYGGYAIGLVVLTLILGLYFNNLYSEIHVKSRVLLLQQLCIATGVAFLVQGLISYLSSDLRVPVRVMLLGSLIVIVAIFLDRLLFGAMTLQAMAKTQLLMVGTSPILAEISRYIEKFPETGLEVAGYAAGDLSLREKVLTARPGRVVLGLTGRSEPAFADELLEIRFGGFEVETAANMYERVCSKISIYDMDPARVIFSAPLQSPRQKVFYRHLFNRGAGLVALIATSPLILLASLAVLFTSGLPVFDRERLAGLNGKPFGRYRFRLADNAASKVIQKLGLAGLPQLLNVVKGEMAIVGPKADRPEYLEAIESHIPFYRERCRTKPGITGWEQVQWKDESAPPDAIARLEYDLYYLKNSSLTMDTLILLHSLKRMLVSS